MAARHDRRREVRLRANSGVIAGPHQREFIISETDRNESAEVNGKKKVLHPHHV